MNKFTVLLVLAGTLSMLAGCKEDKPAEVVQTVEWYKAHKAERAEVLVNLSLIHISEPTRPY